MIERTEKGREWIRFQDEWSEPRFGEMKGWGGKGPMWSMANGSERLETDIRNLEIQKS